MRLTLLSERNVNLLEVTALEAELTSRLMDSYNNVEFCGRLPAPSKYLSFRFEGVAGGRTTLCAMGSPSDITRAIARWCTCCSKVTSHQRIEYETGEDRWFADDPETGRSVIRHRVFEPTTRSIDHHVDGSNDQYLWMRPEEAA